MLYHYHLSAKEVAQIFYFIRIINKINNSNNSNMFIYKDKLYSLNNKNVKISESTLYINDNIININDIKLISKNDLLKMKLKYIYEKID